MGRATKKSERPSVLLPDRARAVMVKVQVASVRRMTPAERLRFCNLDMFQTAPPWHEGIEEKIAPLVAAATEKKRERAKRKPAGVPIRIEVKEPEASEVA